MCLHCHYAPWRPENWKNCRIYFLFPVHEPTITLVCSFFFSIWPHCMFPEKRGPSFFTRHHIELFALGESTSMWTFLVVVRCSCCAWRRRRRGLRSAGRRLWQVLVWDGKEEPGVVPVLDGRLRRSCRRRGGWRRRTRSCWSSAGCTSVARWSSWGRLERW